MTIASSYPEVLPYQGKRRTRSRVKTSVMLDEKYIRRAVGQTVPTSPQHSGYGIYEVVQDYTPSRYADVMSNEKLSRFREWDLGAPFYKRTYEMERPTTTSAFTANKSHEYSGPMWPSSAHRVMGLNLAEGKLTNSQLAASDQYCPSLGTMFAAGGSAIAQTLPSVPEVSLSTSIGELREGLPSLIGWNALKDRSASSVGGEYLNYQFGIKPMISDIQNIAAASRGYDDFRKKWDRQGGRTIRRSVDLGRSRVVLDPVFDVIYPPPGRGSVSLWGKGSFEQTTVVVNEMWFSGAYKVAAPSPTEGQFKAIKDFTHDFGLVPDLSTVWNLTAWSWLLGWFVSLDDLITNLSYMGKRGVSLQYGYIMAKTTMTTTQTNLAPVNRGGVWVPTLAKSTYKVTTKQRRRASRFGFGVAYDGLDLYQRSILAALGISRVNF